MLRTVGLEVDGLAGDVVAERQLQRPAAPAFEQKVGDISSTAQPSTCRCLLNYQQSAAAYALLTHRYKNARCEDSCEVTDIIPEYQCTACVVQQDAHRGASRCRCRFADRVLAPASPSVPAGVSSPMPAAPFAAGVAVEPPAVSSVRRLLPFILPPAPPALLALPLLPPPAAGVAAGWAAAAVVACMNAAPLRAIVAGGACIAWPAGTAEAAACDVVTPAAMLTVPGSPTRT